MDCETFTDHLLRATEWCRTFTMEFVVDSLPTAYTFGVRLNCSYDLNALRDGEVIFPRDMEVHGEYVGPLSAEAVVSLLWRDGRVPEWIDIRAWDADENTTHFELECCGRFTADQQLLYYNWNDVPPFGVKGPVFPPRLALPAPKGEPVEKFRLAESRQILVRSRRLAQSRHENSPS